MKNDKHIRRKRLAVDIPINTYRRLWDERIITGKPISEIIAELVSAIPDQHSRAGDEF